LIGVKVKVDHDEGLTIGHNLFIEGPRGNPPERLTIGKGGPQSESLFALQVGVIAQRGRFTSAAV
jgi:hypothetical protein